MFVFPSTGRSDEIEAFVAELAGRAGEALKMPLALARGGDLGSSVHAVQAIATWAEASKDRELVLPESFATSKDVRRDFASTLPGMAALYFADTIRTPLGSLNRFELLEEVSPFVHAMDAADFSKTTLGHGVALCCFSGAKQEFLAPLYSAARRGAVRQTADFRLLVSRMLRTISERAHEQINHGLLEFLGDLIQELVQNADEHGSVDLKGNRLKRSMRGVLLRYSTIRDIAEDPRDTSLQYYLTKLELLPTGRNEQQEKEYLSKQAGILELSIFDTGPGLALRWMAERKGVFAYADIDAKEEVSAVDECFRKHATTKSGSGYGFGLARSLQLFRRLNVLLSLRTGRLSLVQDFSRTTDDAYGFNPKGRFPKRESLEAISGACYTICIRVD